MEGRGLPYLRQARRPNRPREWRHDHERRCLADRRSAEDRPAPADDARHDGRHARHHSGSLLGQGDHQRNDRLRRPPRGHCGNRHGNGRLSRAVVMSLFPADIEEKAARILTFYRERRLMLSTAESCTGGLIAGALTEIAGSSAVVDRGFVTYTNEAKMALIGVAPATLDAFGAV